MGQEGTEGPGTRIVHIVDFSVHFAKIYDTACANDDTDIGIDRVDDFIEHVEQKGLINLPGRLKNSWDVDPQDPLFASKTQFAKKYRLWHYHIGVGKGGYDESRPYGDWTSQWVIHLRLHECGTRSTIVDWDPHPPFRLPSNDRLWRKGEVPF